MRVWLEDGSTVDLAPRSFVAEGGEAAIHAIAGVAYKVYEDPPAALDHFDRLEPLRRCPHIVLPDQRLRDASGRTVGHTMRFLDGHVPLRRLFTRSFRERRGVGHDQAAMLAGLLRDAVEAVHTGGVVIGDLNALNVLVDPALTQLALIDTACWQTPGFPVRVAAADIRDPKSTTFDEGTDWYAFAVLVFQLLVGMHPYRGTHPAVSDFHERRRRHLSALRPEVGRPPAAYPLASLGAWRPWLEDVLERGGRRAPAPVSRQPLITLREPDVGSATLRVEPLDAPVPRGLATHTGPEVRVTLDGVLSFDADRAVVGAQLRARALELHGGRALALVGDKLVEVVVRPVGSVLVASAMPLAQVHPLATRLFRGVAVQTLADTTWLTVSPEAGKALSVRVEELLGARVLDAVAHGTAAAVRTDDATWLLRFDLTGAYDVERRPPSDDLELVVTPGGIGLLLEDDDLLIFDARRGGVSRRSVRGTGLHGAQLLMWSGAVAAARGHRLYRVSTTQ